MFDLATNNRVTFDVNVSGTIAPPTVRAVVGDSPSFTYPAKQLKEGSWEVDIKLPEGTKPGKLPFKIEVLLNGRLFTPITTLVEVAGAVADPVIVAAVTPPPKAEPIKVEPIIKAEPPKPKKEPKVAPAVLKTEEPPTPFREAAGLSGLAALAKAPIVPLPKRAVAVPEVEVKAAVRFSLADIDEEATRLEAPRREATVKEAITQHVPHVPVTVIKGDVIYR